MAKTPLGRLDPRAFGMLELPRLDPQILDGFRALGDLTGTTSDAMDEIRLNGVVPGSTLRSTDAKARVVGQAITVLNQRREAGEMKKSGLGEIEAHNLAEPGIRVSPGDLVIADEVGVCFVPFERAAEVLAVARRLTKREDDRLAKLDSGMPLREWIKL
jgi:4-hydroxy-4-methyl-2-oxoglutarate aldolase